MDGSLYQNETSINHMMNRFSWYIHLKKIALELASIPYYAEETAKHILQQVKIHKRALWLRRREHGETNAIADHLMHMNRLWFPKDLLLNCKTALQIQIKVAKGNKWQERLQKLVPWLKNLLKTNSFHQQNVGFTN